jgi:hypothetical protein
VPIAAPQLTEEAKVERGLVVPGAAPKVDPLWLAVAAGDIHGEGRLFMPQPTDVPLSPGPARERSAGTTASGDGA